MRLRLFSACNTPSVEQKRYEFGKPAFPAPLLKTNRRLTAIFWYL
jgi:hypothetical protein